MIFLDKPKSNSVVKLKYARYSLFDVQFTDIFVACTTLCNVGFDLTQMYFLLFCSATLFTKKYNDSFYINPLETILPSLSFAIWHLKYVKEETTAKPTRKKLNWIQKVHKHCAYAHKCLWTVTHKLFQTWWIQFDYWRS